MGTNERSWSVFSALGLSVLGTTCCALPLTLVALGAGGAVASLASAAPWLIALSQYKAWTFAGTAALLGYAWWQASRVAVCDVADAARLRWQRGILILATALLVFSIFAAYALLPITIWIEGSA
jgi:hypothetical protein